MNVRPVRSCTYDFANHEIIVGRLRSGAGDQYRVAEVLDDLVSLSRHRIQIQVGNDGSIRSYRCSADQSPLTGVDAWDHRGLGRALPLAESFVAAEEKQFVFPDGDANGSAELILPEVWLGIVERFVKIVGSMQCIVSEEFESRSVQFIGPDLVTALTIPPAALRY